MPIQTIDLTDPLAEFVDASVAAGRFENASEVVREGLRLLQQREQDEELKLQALRAAVEVGRADVREGRVVRLPRGQELAFVQGLGRTGVRRP